MSYVIAAPEMMTAAATDVATIGSNLSAAHMVAAAPTVAVLPAAADEVSASIAQLFSQFGQDYQAMAAQVAAFEEQFVQTLNAAAVTYAAIEAFIAADLQFTIPLEERVVSTALANPTSLLTPGPYEDALLAPFVYPALLLYALGFMEISNEFGGYPLL
ncbi:MAG: PE family protein [Mycobacterium sp.]|uniref:PE family protein n=1 Tax=Mycobacterium sp. TaxID=1785 RepID=UPI003F954FCA